MLNMTHNKFNNECLLVTNKQTKQSKVKYDKQQVQ